MHIESLMIIMRVVKVTEITLESSLHSFAEDSQDGDTPILRDSMVDSCHVSQHM